MSQCSKECLSPADVVAGSGLRLLRTACTQFSGRRCQLARKDPTCSRAQLRAGRVAQGSQAYARALAKARVLTEAEAATIVSGLDTVAGEWETGVFKVCCYRTLPYPCMCPGVHSASARFWGEPMGFCPT